MNKFAQFAEIVAQKTKIQKTRQQVARKSHRKNGENNQQ